MVGLLRSCNLLQRFGKACCRDTAPLLSQNIMQAFCTGREIIRLMYPNNMPSITLSHLPLL